MRPAGTGARWWLQEAFVAVVVVLAALSSTSLASQPLQQDTSEAETLSRREGGGRSGMETTTPAGGVLNATPEPWEGFTRLVEALDILSALDQRDTHSHIQENAIGGEDEERKKKEKSKRNGRMINEEEMARNLVEEEEEKEGRLFFTGGAGTGNQQVTISVSSMWGAVVWIVLCVLLIKWLVQVVTGKGIDYWGRWATKSYGGGDDYYYYPDRSTYTAYRALDDLGEKYD